MLLNSSRLPLGAATHGMQPRARPDRSWPVLSGSNSLGGAGEAAALVLATSGRLASRGRFELRGGAVVVAVRAIRARQVTRLFASQGMSEIESR